MIEPITTAREARGIRDRLGLSVNEMAARVGVSRMTIWRYENGRTPIPEPAGKLIAAMAAQPAHEVTA